MAYNVCIFNITQEQGHAWMKRLERAEEDWQERQRAWRAEQQAAAPEEREINHQYRMRTSAIDVGQACESLRAIKDPWRHQVRCAGMRAAIHIGKQSHTPGRDPVDQIAVKRQSIFRHCYGNCWAEQDAMNACIYMYISKYVYIYIECNDAYVPIYLIYTLPVHDFAKIVLCAITEQRAGSRLCFVGVSECIVPAFAVYRLVKHNQYNSLRCHWATRHSRTTHCPCMPRGLECCIHGLKIHSWPHNSIFPQHSNAVEHR